jgi:hypothetical protein
VDKEDPDGLSGTSILGRNWSAHLYYCHPWHDGQCGLDDATTREYLHELASIWHLLIYCFQPVVDFIFSLYGIYHLARAAKGRPPASSASYHFFALCLDAGLIPFYVFTAMLSHTNYLALPGADGRWRTEFSTDAATNLVFFITYIVAIVLGSLHIASIGIDLYLVYVFRKIANLPPDMNPLEDNLTSRRKSKHKYKNSSVSDISEKRHSEAPSSRMSEAGPKRRSRAQDSLLDRRDRNSVSFFASRTDQDSSFSPHNPNTARLSRANTHQHDMYQQPYSARTSRANLHKRDDSLTPSNTPSRRMSAMPANPSMSKRHSVVSGVPVPDYDYAKSHASKPSKEELQNDNWFVLNQDEDEDYDPYKYTANVEEADVNDYAPIPKSKQDYEPLPRYEQDDPEFVQQPLRMNPPTPPPQPIAPRNPTAPLQHLQQPSPTRQSPAPYRPVSPLLDDDKENDRTQTMTSAVSVLTSSSKYSNDEINVSGAQSVSSINAAPKGRFYGDLASAMRGVRHHQGFTSPRPKSMVGSLHNTASEIGYSEDGMSHIASPQPRSGLRNSPAYANRQRPKSYVDSVSGTVIRKPRAAEEPEVNPYGWDNGPQSSNNSPRVISRTGVDFMDVGSDLGLSMGRREVSGKVAEEGRAGGAWTSSLFMRKASGAA